MAIRIAVELSSGWLYIDRIDDIDGRKQADVDHLVVPNEKDIQKGVSY